MSIAISHRGEALQRGTHAALVPVLRSQMTRELVASTFPMDLRLVAVNEAHPSLFATLPPAYEI
jgi:hypothetical protein